MFGPGFFVVLAAPISADCKLSFTLKDVASYLGTMPEMLIRTLKALEQ